MPTPIRADIAALSAYHVADAKGMVKLDAMENPYTLPAAQREVLAQSLAQAALNRYPDAAARELKDALRQAMRIPAEFDIMVGNGSDEIIQMIAMAVATPGAVMLSPEPSFVMYRLTATYTNLRYAGVDLNADFSIHLPRMLEAIGRERPAVIFLAYPNNPTGNLFAESDIEAIVAAAPGLVVIDEAYFAFAERSYLPLLGRHRNMVVMRTVSKLGLAGIRLGFLVGSADWLREFDKVRMPYNLNTLTQVVGTHLLRQPQVLFDQAATLTRARGELATQLKQVAGVQVFPSATNFLLLRVPGAPGVFDRLKQRGILVKNLHASHPLLENCLRVTVSTAEENQQFLTALRASL